MEVCLIGYLSRLYQNFKLSIFVLYFKIALFELYPFPCEPTWLKLQLKCIEFPPIIVITVKPVISVVTPFSLLYEVKDIYLERRYFKSTWLLFYTIPRLSKMFTLKLRFYESNTIGNIIGVIWNHWICVMFDVARKSNCSLSKL